MSEWWSNLSFFMQILYCIAVPSALILLLQTFLSLLGFGDAHGGTDVSDVSGLDMHSDIDFHPHNGIHVSHTMTDGGNSFDSFALKMFTLQGIIAFLNVFSWTAIVCINFGSSYILATFIGFVLGLVSMLIVAKMLKACSKLNENGSIDLKNAIGSLATVYIPIPKKLGGKGKVTVHIQEKFVECHAMTFHHDILSTGTSVRVVDVKDNTLIVEI